MAPQPTAVGYFERFAFGKTPLLPVPSTPSGDFSDINRSRPAISSILAARLPFLIIFADTDEQVTRILPKLKLKEMAAHRLIVRENVVLEQGNLD